MFRWYQKAQTCYAYLSDVPGGEDLDHSRGDSEFRRSKWFTRGWTLQELLAPEIVVFYNHDWVEIGTKAFMSELISSITGIDLEFLMGTSEVKASVAQKMSWASDRQTTRLEDTAYCLMGLFDVNMPLLYGEGKKAFYRLQLEIIRNSSDESIFAWGFRSINMIPKRHLSWVYGLLAEDPGAFQRSGDIVEEFSFRPPYTMTNKGLQIMANLISPHEYMARTEVPPVEDDVEYPEWVLTLHCRPRGESSKSIAIYLREGEEGLGWVRLSDYLMSSRYSENRDTIDSDGFERRQIIIQAAPGLYEATARIYAKAPPISLLLDVRSVIRYGYSIYAWMNNAQPLELGKAGVRFKDVYSHSRVFLKCTSPQEDFCLVMTLQAHLESRIHEQIVGLRIFLYGDEAGSTYNDRVRLLSGKVVKIAVKRRAEAGKPIYAVQILIEQV
jgi:hypothetical protein